MATARLTLRVDLGGDRAIGPGKIRLLEAIRHRPRRFRDPEAHPEEQRPAVLEDHRNARSGAERPVIAIAVVGAAALPDR